jgi:hypothetical protein
MKLLALLADQGRYLAESSNDCRNGVIVLRVFFSFIFLKIHFEYYYIEYFLKLEYLLK